jgi:PAS domain S-box-containing protein
VPTTGQHFEWEAGAWLAAIVSSSEDAILSMDLGGTLATWNPGAERLLGYSTDEICGEPVSRLVPDALGADLEEQMTLVRGGEHVVSRDTVRLHKNGEEIEVAEALSLIREPSGAATGISAVLRDISARKRAERNCDGSSSTGSGASAGSVPSRRSGCQCSPGAASNNGWP